MSAGETTKTVTVLVKGDTKRANHQYFYLDVTSAANAVIADGRSVGMILGDDKRR